MFTSWTPTGLRSWTSTSGSLQPHPCFAGSASGMMTYCVPCDRERSRRFQSPTDLSGAVQGQAWRTCQVATRLLQRLPVALRQSFIPSSFVGREGKYARSSLSRGGDDAAHMGLAAQTPLKVRCPAWTSRRSRGDCCSQWQGRANQNIGPYLTVEREWHNEDK